MQSTERSPSVLWSFVAGASLGGAALGFSLVYFGAGATGRTMTTAGTVAAAVVGGVFWWYVVETTGELDPVVGGALAGGGTGAAAHPVAWLITFAVSLVRSVFLAPMVVFSPLLAVPATVLSLLFVGWVTVPVGLVTGALVGVGRRLFERH